MYGPSITKNQFLRLITKYGFAITEGHQYFEDLADNTKRNYKVGCANLLSVCIGLWGNEPDGLLLPRDAQLIVDELIEEKGPGSARATVACMGSILGFMILYTDLCQNTHNPFDLIKVPSSENIPAWTKEEIAKHLELGTPYIKTLVAILYDTAQRLSDAIKITYHQVFRNDTEMFEVIELVQEKTGTTVRIPLMKNGLIRSYVRAEFSVARILEAPTPDIARYKYKIDCEKVGLTPLPLHGLRKSAVIRMIEAGATEFEVMAITGHKSAASLRSYIGGYDKDKAGAEAFRKVAAHGR